MQFMRQSAAEYQWHFIKRKCLATDIVTTRRIYLRPIDIMKHFTEGGDLHHHFHYVTADDLAFLQYGSSHDQVCEFLRDGVGLDD